MGFFSAVKKFFSGGGHAGEADAARTEAPRDEAAQAAFEKQIRNNKIKRFLKLREIKALVKHVVPKELIRRVQTVRKGQIR